MATRPTALPIWATSGPKLLPPSGKQAAGYNPGEEPSAQWDNYREDLQRQWIEYLRDVGDESAVVLGGADASDLPTLFDQGAFSPTLAAGTNTYTIQRGYYSRVGANVTAWVDVEWDNSNAPAAAITAGIVAPFEPVTVVAASDPEVFTGPANVGRINLGTFSTNNYYYLAIDSLSGANIVLRVVAGPGGPNTQLNLGIGETRRIVGQIAYVTNGSFNY